ncbi:MAG: carbohydrate kinase family protein, partial [Candidatus Thorarchaeota archaeon]
LSSFDEEGRALQRDLVENLPHSNKSILAYLRNLEKFGLSRSGTVVHNGKRVVYHKLTKVGWGFSRFFFEGLPVDISELTGFLLEDYLKHIITIYQEQGIADSEISDIFTRTRGTVLLDGSEKFENPDFVVFGASSYSTVVECDEYPNSDYVSRCKFPSRFPGGPTAKLAAVLCGLGFKVTLVSSVGDDQYGWNIISDLMKTNVDISDMVVVVDKHTNETIIVKSLDEQLTLIGIDDEFALSITSPSQVPWAKLSKAKAIYIGEVFVEVAAAIAVYAKSHNIPVIYRCSVPFLEMGVDILTPVLSQVDIILLSHQAWRYLHQSMGDGIITTLRSITDSTIIARMHNDTYRVIQYDKEPYTKHIKRSTTDITEWFTCGLMKAITDGLTLKQSVAYGIQLERQGNIDS